MNGWLESVAIPNVGVWFGIWLHWNMHTEYRWPQMDIGIKSYMTAFSRTRMDCSRLHTASNGDIPPSNLNSGSNSHHGHSTAFRSGLHRVSLGLQVSQRCAAR